jgi:O-acetylhomoserine/O-acetylserine sulfhydrylase-like pyridoxal-dependent enzyme
MACAFHAYDTLLATLPLRNKQNKQTNKNFKVWLRQGSKVETTKHTGVKKHKAHIYYYRILE